MVADFYVVLDVVQQLNRESFGGIKDDLEIVRLVAIAGLDSKILLFANRVGQFLFCNTDEVSIQQVSAIFTQSTAQGLPCLQVVAHYRGLRLLFDRAWAD